MEVLYYAAIFFLGWKVRGWWATYYINRMLDKFQEQHIEGIGDYRPILLELERYENMVYAYNSEDGTFLAQATTLKELTEMLSTLHPGQSFNAKAETLERVGFK